jgi:Methyltransferase FkbM domain
MNMTKHECQVHIFDPILRPGKKVAARHNFSVYDMGLSGHEHDKYKRLDTIMKELGHSHIHVLKIDIEGGERGALPHLKRHGSLEHVDQLAIEFHTSDLMKQGLDILVSSGFGIVYARSKSLVFVIALFAHLQYGLLLGNL